MEIAGYKIQSFEFGRFRLDGGAMFGSVPKNLWSKLIDCDEENCIPLSTRSLLLEGQGKKILIDLGNGDKWNDKLRKIFAIENHPLDSLPFKAEEITDIILTHLHFDHAGGISYYEGDILTPRYPNATVHIQAANYENATTPTLRERASYLAENVTPLESIELNLLRGDGEVLPGIEAYVVNGHTTGQQVLRVFDEEQSLYFLTDLCPTSRHLPVPYNMGYDVCATTVMEEKERILKKALTEDAILVFEHDPDTAAGKLKLNEKGHFALAEKVEL